MFYYKTLEALKLKPDSPTKIFFSVFAPLAASPHLTGGVQGADLLSFSTPAIAAGAGITLFSLRIIGCVDASVKFPARLTEIKNSWNKAWARRDYKELSRLIVTGLTSVGFAACVTDSIYAAIQIILGWMGVPGNISIIPSFIGSVIGAFGLFPLTLYWTHRGLKQLTFGGEIDQDGNIADPTDRYTFAGLLLVLPNILGILGSSASVSGEVFGRLGVPAEIIRIISATIYAVASATPGMSTLLRAAFPKTQKAEMHVQEPLTINVNADTISLGNTEKVPLLNNSAKSGLKRYSLNGTSNSLKQKDSEVIAVEENITDQIESEKSKKSWCLVM